jgi:endonuclease/exonuclease/phosphatase family metal-dependent hydrolase
LGRRLSILAGLLMLAGCGHPLPLRTASCAEITAPAIKVADDQRTLATRFSVLTYNIEGLGWPARGGRAPSLRKIGAHLAELRAQGRAPDVVMFQEMFSGAAKQAVLAASYPSIVSGPGRIMRPDGPDMGKLPGKSKIKRGEVGLRLTSGGLAIASRYPIVNSSVRAYGRRSCAGIDCLANKGIMLARVAIPGVPFPIDLYNTHMNSRGASRAPARRHLAAHDRQAFEASDFINDTHDDAIPLIFGGDFNMRDSLARWDNFTARQPLMLVHKVCAEAASGCDVQMSWDGDDPWMDTQDLQFFWSGVLANIRPVRVEAMFDGGPGGPVLSDHDAFLVTYELRWPRTFASSTPLVHPACSIFMPQPLSGGASDRRGRDDLEID